MNTLCEIPWCEEYTTIHTPWHQQVLKTFFLPATQVAALQVVLFAKDKEQPRLALVAINRDLFEIPDHVSVGLSWNDVEEIAHQLASDEMNPSAWSAIDARNSNLPVIIQCSFACDYRPRILTISSVEPSSTFIVVMSKDTANAVSETMLASSEQFKGYHSNGISA